MDKNISQNNKQTFFLYARKSSESEDRQVQSIDDQVNRLKDLAHLLHIDIKEILTESKSAKKPLNRPIFIDMLKRIERGEAQGILCWQINRLSRNPIDSGTISWMLQQNIIRCIQTIDRVYLPDDNVLLFNVESGMANQYIIDLRKNSKRGMEGKAERGWQPSRASLGYLNDRLERTIIADNERFHLVRRMWDLMLTGHHTPARIREIANTEWGFRSPKTKRSGGGELSVSVMYTIFTNIFYTGMFEWNGKLYNGKHTPMITLEEYDRVQIILGKDGKPRSKTHEFAYTGIIKCGECGSMITATEKNKLVKKTGELKSYIYYHCTRRKKGASGCLQRKPLTVKDLEQQIDRMLERITILPQFEQWALEVLSECNDTEIEDRTKIYEMQHQTLTETQKELDTLTRMRYKELIDDDTFIRERDSLHENIVRIKNQLRGTEDRAEKWIELTERTFHFTRFARINFAFGTLLEKREIFNALGQNFSLKGKRLSIEAFDWFAPIINLYPALEAEYRRLELEKSLTEEARKAAFASVFLRWRPIVKEVGTILRKYSNESIAIPLLITHYEHDEVLCLAA